MSCRFRMEDNICKLCWKWRSRPGVRLSASRSSPSWQTHVCISGKPLLACNNLVDYEWMIINISNSQPWCLSWITLTSIYNCDIISFPATHLCSLGGYIMGQKSVYHYTSNCNISFFYKIMLKPVAPVMKKFAKLCYMRRGVNIISLWYILVYILCNQGIRTAATGGGILNLDLSADWQQF